MQIFQIFIHFVIQYQKIAFINFINTLITKVFKCLDADKITVLDASFPKFPFSLKISNFIMATNIISYFPWSDRTACFNLLENIFQISNSKPPICLLVGQVKMVSLEKQPANSALSFITQVPFLDNHHISICNKSALCILPISYIKMIQGLGFSRANLFGILSARALYKHWHI